MPSVGEVTALLDGFEVGDDERAAWSLSRVRTLLASTPAPFSRSSYEPGHLTASGVVLSPDGRQVLLVYHRRLHRWLQPGGHVEPEDESMTAAAAREVLEETGVPVRSRPTPLVVGVDVHPIPAARGEPDHWHHDLALAFRAADTALQPAEEVREAVWCGVEDLDRYEVDDALRRSVARACAVLAAEA